jgi:hypothetical protein
MRNRVLLWELVGMVLITIFGSFLHFLFDLSGGLTPLALISAVNESTWEHLKLAFWPAFVFALAEFRYMRKDSNNFLLGKTIGIYVMPILIIVLFYGYKAVLGGDVFVLDILVFVLAVVLGQFASYKILKMRQFSRNYDLIALIALVFALIVFSTFTYFPPHFELFRDPISGGYGIQ